MTAMTYREYLITTWEADPALDELRTKRRSLQEGHDHLQRELKRLDAGILARKRDNKPHLAGRWETERNAVAYSAQALAETLDVLEHQISALERERRERDSAIHRAVGEAAVAAIALPEKVFATVRPSSATVGIDVQWWTGEWRYYHEDDCTAGAPGSRSYEPLCDGCMPLGYKEPRFGFDAHIYGPDVRWSRDEDGNRKVQPTQINWGTLGSLEIEDANSMLIVHITAVAIAGALQAMLDKALPALPVWKLAAA